MNDAVVGEAVNVLVPDTSLSVAVSVVPVPACAVTDVKPLACSYRPVPEKVAELGVAVNEFFPDTSDRVALSVVPLAA